MNRASALNVKSACCLAGVLAVLLLATLLGGVANASTPQGGPAPLDAYCAATNPGYGIAVWWGGPPAFYCTDNISEPSESIPFSVAAACTFGGLPPPEAATLAETAKWAVPTFYPGIWCGPRPGSTFVVSGTATFGAGSPLAGIGVVISGKNSEGVAVNLGATTNSAGVWEANVPEGQYTFAPAGQGWKPASRNAAVSAATAGLNFQLEECVNVGVPTVKVSASPAAVSIDPHAGGELSTQSTVAAPAPLCGQLQLEVTPSIDLREPAQFESFTSTIARTAPKSISTGTANTGALAIGPLKVPPVVAKDGFTVAKMNEWSAASKGWKETQPEKVEPAGGKLIYSDSPEYLAPSTKIVGRPVPEPGGESVEGVLYREPKGIDATAAGGGDFRVYLNHENRTSQAKDICVVVTNARPKKQKSVALTELFKGASENGDATSSNPVKAGSAALLQWDQERSSPKPSSAHIGGASSAWVSCVAQLGKGNGKTGPVVNAIIDFKASGAVRVGVVAVSAGRAVQFKKAPLKFRFAPHMKDAPERTYDANGWLSNPGETHVSGTFTHDELKVTLPEYDLESGARQGVLLAGDPASETDQYEKAEDTGLENKGNYGVLYSVEVHASGGPGEEGQVLLNPRGIGYVKPKTASGKGYTNGFAGVVDVPANGGTLIQAPDPADPNLGEQEEYCPELSSATAGNTNLVCADLAIALGRVQSGKNFSFAFMPPGGAAGPDAIVLSPAYVRVKPILTFLSRSSGQTATVEGAATAVSLEP